MTIESTHDIKDIKNIGMTSSCIMTGKVCGLQDGTAWLRIYIDKIDQYTYAPKFNISHFENVHLQFESTPTKVPPVLKTALFQSGLGTPTGTSHPVSNMPNIRFSFRFNKAKAFEQVRQLHRLMKFEPNVHDDDDDYSILHKYNNKNYRETVVQHGTIQGVPFKFRFAYEVNDAFDAYASYYPSSQKDNQEWLDFFCSIHWDRYEDTLYNIS